MKPSLLRLQDGSFEVMLGPIQIIRDAWGMRIHLTWPILLTITLTGVRENCGRFGCYGYKPDPTPVSTPHYPTPPCH